MVEQRLIYEFIGTVSDSGTLGKDMSDSIRKTLKHFIGKEVQITISKKHKNKTKKQLGYYWGCIIPHFQVKLFFTQGKLFKGKDVNLMLKLALNSQPVIDMLTGMPLLDSEGRVMRFPIETSDEDTLEREDYHQDCRDLYFKWFSEDLPLPDKNWRVTQAYEKQVYKELKRFNEFHELLP